MGTNYYLHTPPCEKACEHCAAAAVIHLGKSSYGWRFLHRAYREYQPPGLDFPVTDRASWLRLLDLGQIFDEYGDRHTKADLLELIEGKQDGIARDSAKARELSGPYRTVGDDYDVGGYDFQDREFS